MSASIQIKIKDRVYALAQECNRRNYAVYVGRTSVGISGKPHVDFKTAIKQMEELLA